MTSKRGRLLAAAVGVLFGCAAVVGAPTSAGAAQRPAGVYVAGTRLVDAAGTALQLVGVNRSGTEYACAQGWGIFDGPTTAASITAMRSWHVRIVRLPLNEDCWLGINGVQPAYAGANYRNAIGGMVRRLEAAGMDVSLELHWSAPGRHLATGQQVMPDADHSPAFWRSVATAYGVDHRVLFELYNEPHDVSWDCWRNGCTTSEGWRTAGFQQLVTTVRSAGAHNVILLGGLGYSNDLSGWLAHRPTDPARQLAAAWHVYNFNTCAAAACWNSTVAPVAAKIPVITTEFGEDDCSGRFVTPLMTWMDAHRMSYLGWTWDTWDCASGPALISNYNGTPTAFGRAIKTHFLTR